MSHPYTDEFGFPLTSAQAAQWKPLQIDVAGFDYERGDKRGGARMRLAIRPEDTPRPTILPHGSDRLPERSGGDK